MIKITTSIERWISQHFPNLFLKLIQRPRNFLRFQKERRLSQGQHLSQSDHTSILFFTTQKCASRYVNRVIKQLAEPAGLEYADYDAYVTMVNQPLGDRVFDSEKNMRLAFLPLGYYYGPIGAYRAIPDMQNFHVVLQLRDPRDVLTSLYFSTAYSHAVINPKIIRRRREALSMDIDGYALKESEKYLSIYQRYCELLDKRNTLFLRYEDMVADFPAWLKQLSEHIDLTETKAIQAIQKEANFSVLTENKFAQRRQVTPGDYLRKLQPRTIEQLNGQFHPVLEKLGYS